MRIFSILLIFMVFLWPTSYAKPLYYCDKGQSEFRAVDLDTMLGPVRIALFDAYAPITTENFVYYVNQGFYNNTVVHDIQRRFILKAGVYGADQQPKMPLRNPIVNESSNKIKHRAMRVAMWRDGHPDTATSSFFINLNNNRNLDMPHGYAVFGEVIEGMDRVKRMQYQFLCHAIPQTQAECHPVLIRSAKLVNISCESVAKT